MGQTRGSKKKSDIILHMVDADDKDAAIDFLKDRVVVLENELLSARKDLPPVTEHKRAAEALRESEEKFQVLAETMPVAICLYQGERLIYVNTATEHITGYTRDELFNLKLWDFLPPGFSEQLRARWEERRQGKPVPARYEVQFRTKSGESRWIDVSMGSINDKGVPAVFAAAIDITERKQAENALQYTKDQVELYIDLMGHDINNMNQVSMGFIELAHDIIEMEGKLGEDNIVLLDKAMDSLNNSSQLIDNVRKLQREKIGLYEPEVLDAGSVIQDVVKQFDDIPGRDVKITCTYPGHCFVRANALLKDVFINLVGNAVKHSRGPLSINIVVSRIVDNDKIYCRVDVEDDGPGIADQLKHTLFDRLSLRTTRAKGKGFGLCLIKMLVDDYRGRFWVEDRIFGDHTRGARFVVMLPSVEE